MNASKDIFLKQLMQLPELSDNTIAHVFADNPDIDISSREKFFDNIISYFKRFKDNKPDISQYNIEDTTDLLKSWEGKDLRIKNVTLKSVRGFPNADKPFGVDFTSSNDEPQSLIILGGNASGKSSIYDAIEYSYCNSVGEALLRAYKEGSNENVRFMSFLEHNNNGEANIFCNIKTISNDLDIQKHDTNIPKGVRERINPDTHFISDYDIYTNGQLDYEKNTQRSFHNVIARSLGLTDLLEFEKNVKAFTLYRRQTESRNISSLKKSNENQQLLIANNEKSINEKKQKLEALKQQQTDSPDDKKTNELIELLNQIKQNSFQTTFNTEQFKNSIEQFNLAYINLVSKEIKNAGLNEIQFLNLGLELLKEHNDCPFCNNSKILKDEISSSVNQRISKIKELNEVTQSLSKSFNDVTDNIKNIKNQIDILKNKVSREINLIKEKIEFNELFLLDNNFSTEIGTFLAKEFLLELVKLDENPNYLKDKNRFLFELFKSNSNFADTNFTQFVGLVNQHISNRNDLIRKIELEISKNAQPQSLTEQIFGLNKEITDLERQAAEAKTNIERDTKRIDEIQEQINLFDEVKTETTSFLKAYHNALNDEINKSFAPIKLIVEEVLESYFKIDNREIDLEISKQPEEYDEETGEVLSEIIIAQLKIKNKDIPPQPVNKYLNTFHFRLFSTMVGISIAIASRKNTKVNLPLVLDDIFYASDFENRTTVEHFLKHIFKAFKEYTPEMPLQLILFTHDQLIFESAIKVVKEIEGSDIGFAKLFPYTEADDKGDFKNLIYKFPDYFPTTIMNSILA
jgi:tRNA U34 5-methylaminomethyl-2-thiouridine-forming methyltransferase MnmC